MDFDYFPILEYNQCYICHDESVQCYTMQESMIRICPDCKDKIKEMEDLAEGQEWLGTVFHYGSGTATRKVIRLRRESRNEPDKFVADYVEPEYDKRYNGILIDKHYILKNHMKLIKNGVVTPAKMKPPSHHYSRLGEVE